MKEQLDLFDKDSYHWVISSHGKPLYRQYPGLKDSGITVGEMIRSKRWGAMEALYYLTKEGAPSVTLDQASRVKI